MKISRPSALAVFDAFLAVSICGVAATLAWVTWPKVEFTRSSDLQLSIGDRLRIPTFEFAANRTLVAVVEPTCPACNKSRPSITAMIGACHAERNCAVRVVTLDVPSRVQSWLGPDVVGEAEITRVARGRVPGIYATPTIVLADSEGQITDLAVGVLDDGIAATLLSKIASASRGASISTEPAPTVRVVKAGSNRIASGAADELFVEVQEAGPCRHRDADRACVFARNISNEAGKLKARARGRAIVLDCTVVAAPTCRSAVREFGKALDSSFTVAVY